MLLTNSLLTNTSITSPTILDEQYTLKLISNVSETINNPVGFSIPTSPITLPLSSSDILFTYETISTNNNAILGSLNTNIFYPVGTTFINNGLKLKIDHYANIVPFINHKILNAVVDLVDGQIILPVSNNGVEDSVTETVNSILQLDNSLKTLLTGYSVSGVNFSSSYMDQTSKSANMDSLTNFILSDNLELKYYIDSLNNLINGVALYTPNDLKSVMTILNTKYNTNVYSFGYYDKFPKMSIYSFIKWILTTTTLDKAITIPYISTVNSVTNTIYNTMMSINLTGNNATLTITPDYGNSQYTINITNITQVPLTMDNTVFTLSIPTMVMINVNKTTSQQTTISSITDTDNVSILIQLFSQIINGVEVTT